MQGAGDDVAAGGDAVYGVAVAVAAAFGEVNFAAARPFAVGAGLGEHPAALVSRWHRRMRVEAYQIAGQSQSPLGNLAVTSTFPYLMVFLPMVVRRADRTGGIRLPRVSLLWIEQLEMSVEVQLPSPPALVRLRV